jgi:hypothetical protein
MDIGLIKTLAKLLFGFDSFSQYMCDVVSSALERISADRRATIAAAYNSISRACAVMCTFTWLCPTRWQSAYQMLILAVSNTVDSLNDFRIEPAELTKAKDSFAAAVAAWNTPDVPDTDVDFNGLINKEQKP